MLGFPQQAVIYSLLYAIFNEKVLAGGQGWLQMSALFAFLTFFPSGPFLAGAAHRLLLREMWVWGGRDAAGPEPGVWSWCWSSMGGCRAVSTQGSTGAPKRPCWEEPGL